MSAFPAEIDFKSELGALRVWFSTLNDSERATAIYILVQQASRSQIWVLLEALKPGEFDPSITAAPASGCDPIPRTVPDCQVALLSTSSTPNRSLSSCGYSYIPHRSLSATGFWKRSNMQPSLVNDVSQDSNHGPSNPRLILAHHQLLRGSLNTLCVGQNANLLNLYLGLLTSRGLFSPTNIPGVKKIPRFPKDGSNLNWLDEWLKCLRLHKYTENLRGLQPGELLELDEEELQRRGIDTFGARTKLLTSLRDAKEQLAFPEAREQQHTS